MESLDVHEFTSQFGQYARHAQERLTIVFETALRYRLAVGNTALHVASPLGQYFSDDLAMDIGQAEIAALMSECQPLVIDAQAMQDGSVKVVDVNRVLLHVVAEVVGFAEHDTGLDTAARHPLGVTAWVMVSAVVGFCESALAVNRASELATPNDQRVV